MPEARWPIVYSPRYNITFLGLEKLHPFDAGKWGKVISFLKEEKLLSDGMLVEAREASDEDLLVVHTRRYLNELKVQGQGPGGCQPGGAARGGAAQPGRAQPRGTQFLSILQGKQGSLWSPREGTKCHKQADTRDGLGCSG